MRGVKNACSRNDCKNCEQCLRFRRHEFSPLRAGSSLPTRTSQRQAFCSTVTWCISSDPLTSRFSSAVSAGSSLLIRTISMQTFYTVMTSYGARMGTAVIAAHAIARQCASLEALVCLHPLLLLRMWFGIARSQTFANAIARQHAWKHGALVSSVWLLIAACACRVSEVFACSHGHVRAYEWWMHIFLYVVRRKYTLTARDASTETAFMSVCALVLLRASHKLWYVSFHARSETFAFAIVLQGTCWKYWYVCIQHPF